MMSALFIALGIAFLYWGGEVLVTSAIRIARGFGVSPLIIGLTIVAFATSSPELAVSISATLQGKPAIAVGNAFGSNIANLALILGLCVVFYPIRTTRSFIRREVVFMMLVTLMVFPIIRNQEIDRLEGAFFFGLLCLFLGVLVKNPPPDAEEELGDDEPSGPLGRSYLGIILGIFLLVGGAQLMILGATDIAERMGISERVIGLTIFALGTSLPELAACMIAAKKGQSGIVLGNVIGSNIFNLLCILGLTALIHPLQVTPQAMGLDFWVMGGISLLTLVLLYSQAKMVRWEGALLLSIYCSYTIYLLANSSS